MKFWLGFEVSACDTVGNYNDKQRLKMEDKFSHPFILCTKVHVLKPNKITTFYQRSKIWFYYEPRMKA